MNAHAEIGMNFIAPFPIKSEKKRSPVEGCHPSNHCKPCESLAMKLSVICFFKTE